MKKYLKSVIYLLVAVLVGVTAVYAGDLIPSGDQTGTNTMHNLQDIYKLATGDGESEITHTLTTSPELVGAGHTLNDVYDAVLALTETPSSGGLPATGQTSCWDTAGDPVADCTGTGQDGDSPHGTALSYTDNHNGTVTDDNTGLTWVKEPNQIIPWTSDKGNWTTDTLYSVGDLVKDTDNSTFWVAQIENTSPSEGTFAEDRTARSTNWTQTLWVKNDDGIWQGQTWQDALTNCNELTYGGSSNWRLPNIKELQSLVDFENISPALDTSTFTSSEAYPTSQSGNYWSSTSYQDEGAHNDAWLVGFGNGYTDSNDKTSTLAVRCVR
jgi:hypothetical protein